MLSDEALSPQARYNRWARQHPEVRAKEAAAQKLRRLQKKRRAAKAAYQREYCQQHPEYRAAQAARKREYRALLKTGSRKHQA